MVEILAIDFRNLQNSDLSIYHPDSNPIGDEELSERTADSQSFRSSNGLTEIGQRTFYNQAVAPQPALLFTEYLNAAGLETEATDDFIAAEVVNQTPHRDDRAAFVFTESAKGQVTNTPTALADVISDPVLSEQIYVGAATAHVVEPTPKLVADHDKLVNENLQEVLQFLRQYLR
jgi:hypothetical protein